MSRCERARRMWPILLVAAAAACTGGDGDERPEDYAGPWIRFDSIVHDFGECYAGEPRTHVFTVTNVGKAPLTIEDTKKDCGCTEPEFDKRLLDPGESAHMKVQFRAPFVGNLVKRIWVYSNDEYQRETRVELHAKGLGPAVLEPSVVTLDDIVPQAGLRRRLHLRLPPGKELVKVEFNVETPWMAIEPVGPIRGREASFELHVRGPRQPMKLREQIPVFITTKGKDGKVAAIAMPLPFQVVGSITPEATADPPVVHFGAFAARGTRHRELDVETPGWGRPRAVRVEGDDGLEVRAREGASPSAYEVTLAGEGPAGRVAGRATFDFGDGRVVIVPILGWRRS